MVDIFKNPTTKLPTSDSQIVRVDMEQLDIGGRKSQLPKQSTSPEMAISHVPNSGSSGGGGK